MAFNNNYDVIVAGAGPSGIAAALVSARNGLKTLLIEWQGSVGGISTSGLMSHFTGRVDSPIYREILEKSGKKNKFITGSISITIDPEMLKITYYEMLQEAGVEILLYTFVCDTLMEGNNVVGVVTEGKSGRVAYDSKIVIDCTGDGDVAFHAGAEFFKGRESDGQMQPATLMFKVGGVDYSKAVFPGSFETKVKTPKGELQKLASEKLPSPAGHVLLYPSTLPGIVTCNMTNCTGIDGTDSRSLTRAELICRSQMVPIAEFLREYAPGFENCYIISAASLIGVRETRHFKGLFTITEKDILEARQFDDWAVKGAHFNFDIHNLCGSGLDKTGVQKHFSQEKGYTIPMGCMIPEKISGLLLSGRNISGTHMAHSNFRAMPICIGIGAAAGAIALAAIHNNVDTSSVKAGCVQKILDGDKQ